MHESIKVYNGRSCPSPSLFKSSPSMLLLAIFHNLSSQVLGHFHIFYLDYKIQYIKQLWQSYDAVTYENRPSTEHIYTAGTERSKQPERLRSGKGRGWIFFTPPGS